MRVAVVDLGSTSFRLVVADWVPEQGLVPHAQRRERLNLGMVVGREGRIPEPYARAAVKAVGKLRRRAEAAGAERLVAVATSALRDARNREKVARRIAVAAGVPVRILSGDEEAALTYHALRAALPLGERRVLGVDLGGGSLELAVGTGPHLEWTGSLTLGASRLVGRFVRTDPLSADNRAALTGQIDAELGSLQAPGAWPDRCVVAGGTAKAIARTLIASGDAGPGVGPMHGLRLEVADIESLSSRILALDTRELLAVPGIDRHRATTLGAGALVIARLARHLGLAGITVSAWGLREGVILDALHLAELADVGMPELVLTG